MREFIEDALEHRDDGYGRAQKALKPQLPKRFYTEASAGKLEDGYAVLLDGRPTRTPGRVPVRVPVEAIAAHMASEWNAQGKEIDAETMPLVRLVNSAIEGGAEALAALRAEVLKYCGTDLLFYRADSPAELAAEQDARWDAILTALARQYGIAFETTHGISHVPQPASTLEALGRALEPSGLLSATALVLITGICGSGLIAIALRDGLVTPEDAWQAAHVDDYYNMKLWGADPEAIKRLDKRRRDFDAAVIVLSLAAGA